MVKHQHRSRSRNDIIASILEIANGNRVRATEIQFKAYVSYSILKEYLVLLLESDLLEYIEGKRAFKTVPKGMQFLRTYNQMGELVTATNAATKKPGSESLF
jgi:predicted transcriptional regulator